MPARYPQYVVKSSFSTTPILTVPKWADVVTFFLGVTADRREMFWVETPNGQVFNFRTVLQKDLDRIHYLIESKKFWNHWPKQTIRKELDRHIEVLEALDEHE